MLNANLTDAIDAYNAATAAIPTVEVSEEVMDAAVRAESAAFDLLCQTPALDDAGVAAKLSIAAALLADDYPTTGARLAESALNDLREIRWRVQCRIAQKIAA